MNTKTLSRNFFHKGTETDFGNVELTFPLDGWKLNGKPLAAESVEHLAFAYGLQSLQDTYAGLGKTKTVEEGKAAFAKRLAALIDGTVGQRATASGEPAINRYIRRVVRKALTGANKAKLATFKDDAAGRDAWLMELYGKLPDAAKAKIDEKANELWELSKAEAAVTVDDDDIGL